MYEPKVALQEALERQIWHMERQVAGLVRERNEATRLIKKLRREIRLIKTAVAAMQQDTP